MGGSLVWELTPQRGKPPLAATLEESQIGPPRWVDKSYHGWQPPATAAYATQAVAWAEIWAALWDRIFLLWESSHLSQIPSWEETLAATWDWS